MTQLFALLNSAIIFGTVILYGAVGEILTEKAGNLNLGVPGIMFLGGIAGLTTAFVYELLAPSPIGWVGVLLSFLAALLVSALAGLLYAFLTISLRANQNVTGLTLTIFGAGIANLFGGSLNAMAGGVGQISVAVTSRAYRAYIPALVKGGGIWQFLFSFGFMVYLAIAVALAVSWFLNHSRVGLNLRAVGEDPATADAAGINVTAYKYLAACVGAGISGLGGLYYAMDYIKGTWSTDGTIEALGWLAVALVIFATWRPARAIWSAYLFGVLYWAYNYIAGLSRASIELFKMLPYLVTIAVLVAVSLRRSRDAQPPKSLGLSYFREER